MTRNTEHTFIHPNGKDSSTIDFFLYKQRTDKSITKIERVESYSESVSDHYPVSMTTNVNFKKRSLKATSSIKTVTRIKWNSVDKQQYASIAAKKVSNMNDVIMSSDIDNAVSTVNQLLTDSAKECFPARKKGSGTKKPKLKVMNPKIYHAIHEKKKAFHQWKMNGRPNDPTNFYLLEKKLKTVELRRQIRIETARKRHAEKMSIVNAKQSDNALFHRIIRNQRGKCHKFIDELHVGSQSYSGDEILSGWYEHFKELSSKKVNEKFDLNFMKQVEEEVAIIYMICLDSSVDPKPVTDEEIKKAIASLNRGKAPDVYGVTAEHVYYGGPAVTNCVQTLINNILFNKEIPSSMKLGILNPIFKNKGNCKESQNYRGITITPVLTRLLESVLKSRIKPILLEKQNSLQRGFTENSSPMNCALLVEEFYRNNKDLNKPTYVAFMDVKSAFDVVVHPNLMRKLYNSGVNGLDWLMINSLHHESQTAVKWQGQLSSTYVNQQGVRQGGVLSADLFKVYDNGLLDRIQVSGKGARIGTIGIQAPACADDVTVLSNDPCSSL